MDELEERFRGYKQYCQIEGSVFFFFFINSFFSSPEPKAGELIVYPWSVVRPSSSSSTISNMNISATSGPIATKFYLKHHWVGGKAALGFGPDQIRTLVSMASESYHRVIMEKTVSPLFLGCFSSDPSHTYRQ